MEDEAITPEEAARRAREAELLEERRRGFNMDNGA